MAQSKTELCNVALSMFGGQRIIDIDDSDTDEARLCSAIYDVLRQDLLDSHSWNCAIKRVQLNQLSVTPIYDYDYQYELPSDYVRVLEVYKGKDYPWVIEGSSLLSNSDSVYIKYMYDLTDVSKFSNRFSMTLIAYIAATICYNLTESRPMSDLMWSIYKKRFDNAKAIDGQEGKTTYTETSNWIDIREDYSQ